MSLLGENVVAPAGRRMPTTSNYLECTSNVVFTLLASTRTGCRGLAAQEEVKSHGTTEGEKEELKELNDALEPPNGVQRRHELPTEEGRTSHVGRRAPRETFEPAAGDGVPNSSGPPLRHGPLYPRLLPIHVPDTRAVAV